MSGKPEAPDSGECSHYYVMVSGKWTCTECGAVQETSVPGKGGLVLSLA